MPEPASIRSDSHGGRFSRRLLGIGFVTGLALALACLALSSYYLISFEQHANSAVTKALEQTTRGQTTNQIHATQFALGVHMYMARVLLLSCGIFAGVSFGFLGFCLFLLGVEGTVDAQVEGAAALRLNVAKLAPGAFVIVCSAFLIGICATGVAPTQVTARNPVSMPQADLGDVGQAQSEPEEQTATNAVDPRSPDEVETR